MVLLLSILFSCGRFEMRWNDCEELSRLGRWLKHGYRRHTGLYQSWSIQARVSSRNFEKRPVEANFHRQLATSSKKQTRQTHHQTIKSATCLTILFDTSTITTLFY